MNDSVLVLDDAFSLAVIPPGEDPVWWRDHLRVRAKGLASEPYRRRLRDWLQRKHNVWYPSMQWAETRAGVAEARDNGDIYIFHLKRWCRIEAKSRPKFQFRCADDWRRQFPPDGDVIVCATHQFEKVSPTPYAFVIVSACMEYAVVVMAETRQYWTRGRRHLSDFEDMNQEYFFCPLGRVAFIRLQS